MFASYDAITSTASTLNQTKGLGLSSQFLIYAVELVTAVVFPQMCIEAIGYKFTLILSQCCYLCFSVANIYPRWSTLLPSILLKNLIILLEIRTSFNNGKTINFNHISFGVSWNWQCSILDKSGDIFYNAEQTIGIFDGTSFQGYI